MLSGAGAPHRVRRGLTGAQLKTMQEVMTLVVLAIFSMLYLKETLRCTTVAGFVCIALGAALIFSPWAGKNG